ncbi:hypothetical protein Tco_0121052 [Tanacetum coccineum]
MYSIPLFDDEEIFSTKIDPHSFNAESNLIESLLNRDTLIDSSPKFDYLLEEFSGELAHIDPIPPGIEKADFDLEEEICLVENFDSHTKEIDLFPSSDDSMPPGIENDDYDSKGDIRFLEELLSNDPLPLPEIESSNLDHFNDPSSPRPPPEPPDVENYFDVEPDAPVINNFDESLMKTNVLTQGEPLALMGYDKTFLETYILIKLLFSSMEVLIYYSAMLSAEILLHGTDSVAHGPAISARPQTRNSTFLIYLENLLDKQFGDMPTHDEIFVTPSHTKKVFGNMKRIEKEFSGAVTPLFPTMIVQAQEEMGEADEAANEENVHTHSNDPMLSGEDSLKLNNLMEIYQIATEVLDLENTKTTQAQEISNEGLGDQEDPSKQGRKIDDIDQDAEVTLVDETHGRHDDPQMFDRDVFNGEEVFVAEQSEKSYEKYLILADNVQAMIEAVRLLAKRLQAREQEEVTDEEKARLFVELLKKRKKHFAALRAQEKRNKPPTKSQKKSAMPT